MAVLTHWTKVVPATAGAVLVGWVTPSQAFFPSYLPDLMGRPVTTVPVPNDPTTINVPNEIPVPPTPPPPFVPVTPPPPPPPPVPPPPDPPNGPTEEPTCHCDCNTPTQTPEPATIVSGLIGLGVAGAASRARRRFGAARK